LKKLKTAGLFGGALVSVSGSLAERYNECLLMLGMPPTALKRFSIDCIGWSPEIAEEKDDLYYLNTGEANSNAIIITPLQNGKSVYMPFHSFDKDVMTTIFTAYNKEIRDITKDAAICVQFDQKIDSYYEPFDLLRYTHLSISFELLNQIDKKQEQQQKLIEYFKEANHFIDKEIHEKLLLSAQKYGDLRNRKLRLAPIDLPIKSFYTKAFGGIFVLKDFATDIIVFEKMEVFKRAIQNTTHHVSLYHTSHHELSAALVNHQIAYFDIRKTAKTERYDRIKKYFFVEHLNTLSHPLSEILDSPFLFKKYLNHLDIDTRKKIMSVELYNQRKIVERNLNIDQVVDQRYIKALLEPNTSLEEELKELIWKLLTKIAPEDPLHLYWYDKNQFYHTYNHWEPSFQDWVIQCILKNNKTHSI